MVVERSRRGRQRFVFTIHKPRGVKFVARPGPPDRLTHSHWGIAPRVPLGGQWGQLSDVIGLSAGHLAEIPVCEGSQAVPLATIQDQIETIVIGQDCLVTEVNGQFRGFVGIRLTDFQCILRSSEPLIGRSDCQLITRRIQFILRSCQILHMA